MNYLVDTDILIWLSDSPENIPKKTLALLENTNNLIIVSVACIWEIIIKQNTGKLKLKTKLDHITNDPYYTFLQLDLKHVQKLHELENIHQDPFDRILIAQSLSENMPLITSDNTIKKYPIKTIF